MLAGRGGFVEICFGESTASFGGFSLTPEIGTADFTDDMDF